MNMSSKRISIIMPAYKRWWSVERCLWRLSHLNELDRQDYEFILLDGSSEVEPRIRQLCEEYKHFN